METRLTLRKGIVGIIGDDDFNSGFLKLISKLWEIVIAPRQPIQSTNDITGGNYGPADKNAWTAVIPTMETNYNSLVSNVEKIKSDGTWDRN